MSLPINVQSNRFMYSLNVKKLHTKDYINGLYPRTDITTSPVQEYQYPHETTNVLQFFFERKNKVTYLHFLKRFTQCSLSSFRDSLEIEWEVSSIDTFACRKFSWEKQHFFIWLQCSPLSTTFQGVSYFDFQRSLIMGETFLRIFIFVNRNY